MAKPSKRALQWTEELLQYIETAQHRKIRFTGFAVQRTNAGKLTTMSHVQRIAHWLDAIYLLGRGRAAGKTERTTDAGKRKRGKRSS